MTEPTERKRYIVRALVTVDSPRRGPEVHEHLTICDEEWLDVTRAFVRTELLRKLDEKDLIFGSTIGNLTLTQRPYHLDPTYGKH